ncbi:MAG TPA: hypothetical protein VMF88_05565 [Bacteroidota bacterium]|nr:hypothetical protein [Bacteroidota bacterium]
MTASAAKVLLGRGAGWNMTASAAKVLLGRGAGWNMTASAAKVLLGRGAGWNMTASAAKLAFDVDCCKPAASGAMHSLPAARVLLTKIDSAREIAKFVATISAIVTTTARAFFALTLFCIFITPLSV